MRILELSTEDSVQRLFIDPLAKYLRQQGHIVSQICGFRRTISMMDIFDVIRMTIILKWLKIDVLHVQTAKAGAIGRIAAFLAGTKRVVYTAHDFPFHSQLSARRKRVYIWLEWLLAHFCHAITTDSPEGRNQGLTYGIAPHRKFHVIPVGVDTEKFLPRRRPPSPILVVGTVARLVPDKGVDILIRTLAALKHGIVPVRAIIVGDGPLKEPLMKLAADLGLSTFVNFLGEQKDVRSALSQMDIFVLPTKREGLSVAVMEAMSMGLPVVVSDIPAFRELVMHEQTGLVARSHEWTSMIGELMHSSQHRARLGLAARAHVQKYYEQAAQHKAYERVLVG